MKIYVTHSRNFDFKNDLYSPLRNSELSSKYEIFLPYETEGFINSKELIKKSDLVVAEVSYPSTGEGIELGWANNTNVPIICIYKEGSKLSNSLKAVSETFIAYSDTNDMIRKLTATLLSVK